MSKSAPRLANKLPVAICEQPFVALLDSELHVLDQAARVAGCPLATLDELRSGHAPPCAQPCFQTDPDIQNSLRRPESRDTGWYLVCRGLFHHCAYPEFYQDGDLARWAWAGPYIIESDLEKFSSRSIPNLPLDVKPEELEEICKNIPRLNRAQAIALQVEVLNIARNHTHGLWDESNRQARDVRKKVNAFYRRQLLKLKAEEAKSLRLDRPASSPITDNGMSFLELFRTRRSRSAPFGTGDVLPNLPRPEQALSESGNASQAHSMRRGKSALWRVLAELRPHMLWDAVKLVGAFIGGLMISAAYVILQKVEHLGWDWVVFGVLFALSALALSALVFLTGKFSKPLR